MANVTADQAPAGLISDPSAHAIVVGPFAGGNSGYTTHVILTQVGMRDGAGLLPTNASGQGFDLWLGAGDAGASGRGGSFFIRVGLQVSSGGNGVGSILDTSGNQRAVFDPSNKAWYLYNTDNTDHVSSTSGPTNYERAAIYFSSNVMRVGPQKGGTGTDRNIRIDFTSTGNGYLEGTAANGAFRIVSAAAEYLSVSYGSGGSFFYNYWWTGQVIPITYGSDNQGSSNRLGDSYVFRLRGGSGNTDPSYFGWGCAYTGASGTTRHTQEDALLLRLLGSGQTQLAFGPTFTSTVPSMKRSGTTMQFRLADDSGDAPITVSTVRTMPVTVSALPAASTAGEGARAWVTDANATTYASIVAGGGSNKVPVYSDGTNWRIG